MKEKAHLLLLVLLLSTYAYAEKSAYVPKEGFVPDPDTAIKIAEAVWLPLYGKDIYMKKPFRAKLRNGVWEVQGTMSTNMLGGVPMVEISKHSGEILSVGHGK